ncbi:FliM/FliN family flagellar motor C-terminal domain-containing protein [Leptolyngbya sp. 15MV]|nr:FliM/FliN family flagellar motor C-terminal domain-containing protein [Leptolyngbya sp. 15MV]
MSVVKPDLPAILKLEVPIIVRLGERSMTLREVLELAPGAIIEIPKNADSELDLLVNNKQIGFGHAVKVGENFGLQISYIGDLRSRIGAMAAQDTNAPPPGDEEDPAALAERLLAGQV